MKSIFFYILFVLSWSVQSVKGNPIDTVFNNLYFKPSYLYSFIANQKNWHEAEFEIGFDKYLAYKVFASTTLYNRFAKNDVVFSLSGMYFFNVKRYVEGRLSISKEPEFIYKHKGELEVSNHILKNVYGHIKYNYFAFGNLTFNVWEIGFTYYHLRHSFHIRTYFPDTPRKDEPSFNFQFRTYFLSSKTKYNLLFGSAIGNRFIDILPNKDPFNQRAFSIYGNFEVDTLKSFKFGLNITALKENPDFSLFRMGAYLIVKPLFPLGLKN